MSVLERVTRPRILHLSGDFPDYIEPFKTPVIKSHIDLTRTEFDHTVFSMNRQSPSFGRLLSTSLMGAGRPALTVDAMPFEYGTNFIYHAPGRGLYHATLLRQLGRWLASRFENGPRPELLMGHKLCFEGITIARAARLSGIPYGISIQGNTDTKVLAMRPDLAAEIAKVFHEASVVFPFSPWALRAVERKLGKRKGTTLMLPCPTDLDEPVMPVTGGNGLISVFHLKGFQNKNLEGMAKALRLLNIHDTAPNLTIIGGGTPSELARCQALTADLDRISFAGPKDRGEVRRAMSAARGFILPSLRESFGLVFIEALFAGLPIAYPAGTAVDGYLDNLPFALRVDPKKPASIAEAMQRLDRDEVNLKGNLANWLRSEDARRFTRPAIAKQFSDGLRTAMVADRK